MDMYAIDGHKLMFHPDRVSAWLEAGNEWETLKKIYPIYIEISPIGTCNHRCVFCALDYMGYEPKRLETGLMCERLAEMGQKGVRSIMFAGEGEPLLHTGINEMVEAAFAAGIDVSFTTNGVLLNEKFIEKSLARVRWIKVSCNAGSASTYESIHRSPPGDFGRVKANLRRAVKARETSGWTVSIGMQILLLPENAHEVEELARICRDEIGIDYLVVKPYSQHKRSETKRYEKIDYEPYMALGERLAALSAERFSVVFRTATMANYSRSKDYASCLSTPFFWAYISSAGDLVSCSAFLGDERFHIGNIMEKTFATVWEGEDRRKSLNMMRTLCIEECRSNCRMDKINGYLWRLHHPAEHDNFI